MQYGILKKLVFVFKHLKIKCLYNFTGRNSVAIMTTVTSVSKIAFIVSLFHSYLNWASWFLWEPNCQHWLLRSSLCCTTHRNCESATE